MTKLALDKTKDSWGNDHYPPTLITAQAITAEEYDGVIEESISHEKDLNIVMFHRSEEHTSELQSR